MSRRRGIRWHLFKCCGSAGLTLVQRLAKLHGGAVTANSRGRGMGATFTVRLPAVPEPTHADVASVPA